MEDLKVTDIEIDKIMAPFIDVDTDSDTIYFSERPNWETHKMEDQHQVYLEAMAEFINNKLDLAFHQGQQGQIEMLEQQKKVWELTLKLEGSKETIKVTEIIEGIEALQEKLKSLESKH